jgi:AcrR family transcriptional regulator
VIAGAPCHIAIGFGDREGSRVFKQDQLPDWVGETFAKFIAHGLGGDLSAAAVPRPPRKRRPSAGDSDIRSRLLEAAARVIYEAGFAGASVQGIAGAAGVALATFYAYFASRQALFDELLTYVRTNMLADVADLGRGSRTFIELECRGFHAFFDYVQRNPWYIRIETEAALWAPAAYIRHFHDLADRYIASMQRSRARGELQIYEERELKVVAYIMMAARHYLANRYVLTAQKPHRLPAWVGQTYTAFVAAGLAGRHQAPPRRRPARS